ncbi:MAG: ATP-binding protein [Prevotella sp.]|jgi:DNA transposition AAA+ family ATPase|nr:ATP-binding protein [Prevotella sp.]
MELTQKDKEQIRESLRVYVSKYPSQNKAVGSLKGTSAGTVSCILSGKWENISDAMWRKVREQVSFVREQEWQIVETGAYQEITYALTDAQDSCNVTWVVGEAGSGKTTTAKVYADEHREVFYLQCSEDLHKGEFVREIARIIGIRGEGYTVRELWKEILARLIQMNAPLLIFDEADKLTESVFHYFISLYNKVEDKCGVVFLSTDYIKKRVRNGLRHEKPGYKEFYSRIGRKYFEIDDTTPNDVYAICTANGLTERKDIEEVLRDAEDSDYDLRRVKKSVHRVLKMHNA